ncbi:MAG: hypothetical protein GXY54_08525 [Deltaproteobacteria bacterium]|nr:hypothetical protein [Deltaproteobacteria bacterium]
MKILLQEVEKGRFFLWPGGLEFLNAHMRWYVPPFYKISHLAKKTRMLVFSCPAVKFFPDGEQGNPSNLRPQSCHYVEIAPF